MLRVMRQLLASRHHPAALTTTSSPAWPTTATVNQQRSAAYSQFIGSTWRRRPQQQQQQQQPSTRMAAAVGGGADEVAPLAAPAKPRIVIITGPTAVGKTQLGLRLAQAIGGEVISADSVQVYRGLDVGSDKLPESQREGVPHHLLDILPPSADFSAGDFHALCRQAAADILARGKVPIVVGGTGFYLRWFILGRPTTPPSSPEAAAKALQLIGQAWVRAAAEVTASQQQQQQQAACEAQQPAAGGTKQADAAQQQHRAGGSTDTAELLQRLPHVADAATRAAAAVLSEEQRWDAAVGVVADLGDPQSAERVRKERNNWYRLQRVVQILVLNGGKPLSEMDVDTTRELEYDFRCFFLHRPRLQLFDKIIRRVEEMVAGGLLSEALMLLDQGMQPNSNIATRAIGYRQACEFLQAAIAQGGASKGQLQQLILDIATASRGLVKAQMTWFRDEEMFRWLEVGDRSPDAVLPELLAELDKPAHEGGCGDSGRLDKQAQAALKRYVPSLQLFNDEQRVAQTLAWVDAAVAARRGVVEVQP